MNICNLKQHGTAEFAYNRSSIKNVIPVIVRTYHDDKLIATEYYSYTTIHPGFADLRKDFPMVLENNQTIELITAKNSLINQY